ncbi:hypothetical protein HU200_010087 [Digitaria exilis]|uniref:RING-type E3 ubiquitin transferase n=1 Tax=Digitaria exilis TaxID=1010633 RepID=A0A835FKA4_9POAL|nr:hypothetical protein HU200_010087 [Digitaria exilis]
MKTRSVVVGLMAGLPTVILFTISFRLGSAALRKRRSASGPQVEGDLEDGTLPGMAAGHSPQQHHGCIQLPAAAIAQLAELSRINNGGGIGEDCAICLGKIGDDGVATRQLPVCRHVYHKGRVEQWLRVHPTCPICRCNVLRESPEVILRLYT